MSIAYPPILPLSEVQFLIQTLRERTVAENKVKFFKSLWLVQGHLQKVVVGEDPDIAESSLFGGVQPAVNSDLKELATALQNASVEVEDSGTFGAAPRVGKLGDGTILKMLLEYAPQIISLILLILDQVPDTTPDEEDEDPTPAVG